MRVNIAANITLEWLKNNQIDLDTFKGEVRFLADTFGIRYVDVFPREITLDNADYVHRTYLLLKSLQHITGFDRFVRMFNNADSDSLFFTGHLAQVLSTQFDIELEPFPESDGQKPDIAVSAVDMATTYIECKSINPKDYYDANQRREVAGQLRDIIATPNQLQIEYDEGSGDQDIINELQKNPDVIDAIKSIKTATNIQLLSGRINVVPRNEYIAEGVTVEMHVIMEDDSTGDRRPGCVFCERGRTVAIIGPIIDFASVLERKRGKGRKQNVDGAPFVLAIDSSNILGRRDLNNHTIDRWFQPTINTRISGVLLSETHQTGVNKTDVRMRYLDNPHAALPIPNAINNFFRLRQMGVSRVGGA